MDAQDKTTPISADTQARPQPLLDPKGIARRRFARAGAGATGVLLTLHSQAGMVTFSKTMCKSPSGYMSMKPGASAQPQISCSANRSHGYWKTHPEEWRGLAGMDSSTPFGKFFACMGNYIGFANVTMMQVIDPTPEIRAIDRNNVAMQCVSALLNARVARSTGVPTVLPEDKVIEIWNQFVTRGAYSPYQGVEPWGGADIAAYLESTFR